MSDSDSSSLSSVEDVKPKPSSAKKAKKPEPEPKSKSRKSAGEKRKRDESEESDSGETKVQIGNKRFVSLSNFRGRFLIDIREYYEDKVTGELKPGKKGISLPLEQWEALKSKMGAVDKMIKNA